MGFPLGTAWEEYTADGRTTQTITTIEGNSIIKVQTPDTATGYHTTREEREFSEDGSTMTLRLIIPAKPEIVCARVYKRVVPSVSVVSVLIGQEDAVCLLLVIFSLKVFQ